jgi:hypothetical protein
MIRSALLSFLALPAAFAATSAMAASPACTTTAMAPLPASVPAQEMKHSAPTPASCVNLQAFVERARRPAVAAPAATTVAARPAAQPAAAAPASSSGSQGAYVPKTQHDNTPWRFDMNQNGRRMTAEEFDAWMKAKGIRVATGKPGAATTPAAAPATAAKADCKSSASVGC